MTIYKPFTIPSISEGGSFKETLYRFLKEPLHKFHAITTTDAFLSSVAVFDSALAPLLRKIRPATCLGKNRPNQNSGPGLSAGHQQM